MTVDGGRWTGGQARLPRLALIADGFVSEVIRERVLVAVQAAPLWLHLRDHAAPDEAFARSARMLVERVRTVRSEAPISINTRAEVAAALGVGLHVGGRGPSVERARRRLPEALLSYSAHTSKEAVAAAEQGADVVLFSPVFPTGSKPDHPGVGLDALAACCAALPETPVFALGGITPERVRLCCDAGVYGVAVLSGILHATDPAAATARYLDAL